MKAPVRWHPKTKIKHSNAGLKIEGLSRDTQGGYTFTCKIQSSGILVSLCVARCLCKHMNKNKNEQENGINLAHAYSNGVREEVMIVLLLFSKRPEQWFVHVFSGIFFFCTQLWAVSQLMFCIPHSVIISDNLTNLIWRRVNGSPWHIFPQFIDNLLRPSRRLYWFLFPPLYGVRSKCRGTEPTVTSSAIEKHNEIWFTVSVIVNEDLAQLAEDSPAAILAPSLTMGKSICSK